MTRVLLDTGILSDFINHRRGISDRIRGLLKRDTRVGTCIPVLAEIVAGMECSQSRERNMKALIVGLPVLRLWPFDEAAAFQYGAIFADQGGEREEKPANGGQRGSITTIGNEIGGWVSLSMVLNTTDDLDECVFKDPGLRNPRLGPASPNNLIPGEGCDESWTSEGAMILSVGVDFHWEAFTVSVPIKLNFSSRIAASFEGTCTNGKPCPAPK